MIEVLASCPGNTAVWGSSAKSRFSDNTILCALCVNPPLNDDSPPLKSVLPMPLRKRVSPEKSTLSNRKQQLPSEWPGVWMHLPYCESETLEVPHARQR